MLRKKMFALQKKKKQTNPCNSDSQEKKQKQTLLHKLSAYSTVSKTVYPKNAEGSKPSSGRSLIFWFEKEYCSFKGIFF